jgi:hypothetical protein
VSAPSSTSADERRWRHRANWSWLSPLPWSLASAILLALTRDPYLVLSLGFVPLWAILGGHLAYVLVLLRARWGRPPLVLAGALGAAAGGGAWWLAGIHAALTCMLVAPLIAGYGSLRIPAGGGPAPLRAVLAVGLGLAEPLLVLGGAVAAGVLVVHTCWMPMPGIGWWWASAGTSLAGLAWSTWLLRRWRRQADAAVPPPQA